MPFRPALILLQCFLLAAPLAAQAKDAPAAPAKQDAAPARQDAAPAKQDPPAAAPTKGQDANSEGDSGPPSGTTAPAPAAADRRLFTMDVHNQEAYVVIHEFAKKAGIDVNVISPAYQWITVYFKDLPFDQAMERIMWASDFEFRMMGTTYVVGLPMELKVKIPSPDDKNLDATYRCRHLNAESLARSLANVLPPDVRITVGPTFLTPAVDSNNDPSGIGGGDTTVRALGNTDQSFKIHDVVFSGPAELVRRGLMLARKFDRPRKQVRISIRVAEVSENLDQNLGVSWMSALNLSASEATTNGNLVDGIRLGRFSHSPLTVNATLNALEQQGRSKTLANPSLVLMDGERSFILSGQKQLYPKYTGKDQSGQSIYDIEAVKVGIYLQVAVQVGLNNDLIMSLIPQVTSIASFATFNAASYPTITTREAQTTVHAVHGEMIVLGGLKNDSDSANKGGIPFLKDIPLIGRLFSSVRKTYTKSELMIFLTPEIMEDYHSDEPVKITVAQAAP